MIALVRLNRRRLIRCDFVEVAEEQWPLAAHDIEVTEQGLVELQRLAKLGWLKTLAATVAASVVSGLMLEVFSRAAGW